MIAALLLLLQAGAAPSASAAAPSPAPVIAPLAAAPRGPKDLGAEVDAVVAAWSGDYASLPGQPERRAIVRPLAVPALARRAVFVEVSQADPAAAGGWRIVFQRIIAFSDDPARLRNHAASYYFADAAAHARLDQRPAEAARLTATDLLVFDPRPGACAINLFPEDGGFILTAHKEECRVVSRIRPGMVFHPEFRLTVGKGRFAFFEHGFFENGEAAAPPLTYELRKLQP